MRWNVVTARYMLALSAKYISGLWESYVEPFIRDMLIVKRDIPPKLPRRKVDIEALEQLELDEMRKRYM